MCPMPRAPISATRKRVVGVTRHTVSGTPISPLRELTGATVSATDDRTEARRSLTLVLPDEPVTPTTRRLRRAVDDAAGEPAEGRLDVVDDDARHALDRTRGEGGDGSGRDGGRDEVVPVRGLAEPCDVEAARAALAGVGAHRAVDDDRLRRVGAVDGTAGEIADLAEGQGDHDVTPDEVTAARAARTASRSSNGCFTPWIS